MAARQDSEQVAIDVGRRIGEARRARGLTQEAVAHQLDLSVRHYQALEGGTVNHSVRLLTQIGNLFKVPIAFFFVRPESPAPAQAPRVPRRRRSRRK